MNNPISTYRLQFHKDFTFDHFQKIIPYLKKLGVSTIYASPIFESTPGSTHGYDGVNPHRINPEIGTEEQLKLITQALKAQGISWLQDIVPNHMAFHPNNLWLRDVLEKGRQSVYAVFFDINWENGVHDGRIMVPFLGGTVEDAIKNGELKLQVENGRLVLNYHNATYPLNPRSYEKVLSSETESNQSIDQILEQLPQIHQVEDPKLYSGRWSELVQQLQALCKTELVKTFVDKRLAEINQKPERLSTIVQEQSYALCGWKETDQKINFRRFFTVNGLICLNIQDEKVFSHFHSYIKSLYEQKIFQGLRIDHIDGLADPEKYLRDLRTLVGDEAYIVVEKILEPGEELAKNWPVQGNSGYDFLSMVNNLFTDREAEKPFTKFYRKLVGDKTAVSEQLHGKKAHILNHHMGGELENLYQLFLHLNLVDQEEISVNGDLKGAIAEFLIECPVYRYYGNTFPLEQGEASAIQDILNRIRKNATHLRSAVGILEQALLISPLKGNEEYNLRALKFYQRCMQFTGPLMAKGVEDTLMYTYNRFIGHNEVGDSPESFGYGADQFHDLMIARQKNWPLTLNGTSTHDTKRGEDARARLNVLTELGESWLETVEQWRYLNRDLVKQHQLDANDEYFIYQTLVAVMPMPGQDDSDLPLRIAEYLIKALREGKVKSDWANVNEKYEASAITFANELLDKEKPFFKLLSKFNRKVADFGILNALSQVALKFTCPGVPDVYQGCEFWDLSLVDPDNRRPVDYEFRSEVLEGLEAEKENDQFFLKLWQNRYSGQVKLWLTKTLFELRKANSELFTKGDYIPLKVKGKYKEHVFAFARRYKNEFVVVAIPLHTAKLARRQRKRLENLKWKNTRLILPESFPEDAGNVLSGSRHNHCGEIFLKDAFQNIPLAVLKVEKHSSHRGAGILLHISSLPSPFGIGDFGTGAREFADYLAASGQKYWQLLPLSPTGEEQGYSPYSTFSSMAGNTLLISPELLAQDGLLKPSALEQCAIKVRSEVDYLSAKRIKDQLFDEAYHNFCNAPTAELEKEYRLFCDAEHDWLHDFSLYITLKQQHDEKAWYDWPDKFKLRDKSALDAYSSEHSAKLDKVKWLQFIFIRQWTDLRKYCNALGIQLFGDLPFYVSNDSSDVWANKEIFCLDDGGKMTGIAGVPPDYFNDNGQLWGMPVFKWDVLKDQNYEWWLRRIEKNMQLYDLLRLDHFRAFSSYWDVPAGEDTAKNGVWKSGPGSDFFKVLQQKLGDLPFVAEDLGDVDQAVYDLRDEFNLPGMRVIQFAFGNDLPQSVHSLHNFNENCVAYTGTHDNNTTRGWYRQDADDQIKANIKRYCGGRPNAKNVHLMLAKLAYSSVAKIVILPMQDVIGLDEKSRMNTPASVEKNWLWRLKSNQLKKKYSKRLKEWLEMYNRE